MGIRGARSMMNADTARYCETFTWNWGGEDGPPRTHDDSLVFLVDAKSALYHLILKQENLVYASPATVNETCSIYIRKLLEVVGPTGAVHFFFDGVPPKSKVPQQIERMTQQAINGDRLAKGDPSYSTKLLHHLAEWAFVEAVNRMQQTFGDRLQHHRPAVGEGEAQINQWLVQHPSKFSHVGIISEDSDFLVYDSCDGFLPPSTIEFEDRSGKCGFRAKQYSGDKFMRAFLGSPTNDTTIMTTVAALAGCDYIASAEQAGVLGQIRRNITESDIGGLRPKLRKNPTAAATLTAVLRSIVHFKKKSETMWLDQLCQDTCKKDDVGFALFSIQSIHQVYYYSLQVDSSPSIDNIPGMIEVRRLLQDGLVYCYPVVETFQSSSKGPQYDNAPGFKHRNEKTFGSHSNITDVTAHCLVPLPPITTQLEVWTPRSSVWQFPHFQQIRARLYSYVRLQVYYGRSPPAITTGDFWTATADPTVTEVIRRTTGRRHAMVRSRILVPEHSLLSGMFDADTLLQSDDLSIDRALVFCLIGMPQQLKNVSQPAARKVGATFVASLMLPFNLACLLLMMATVPEEVLEFDLPKLNYDGLSRSEVYQVLPMLSVACAHATLLTQTILSLWAEKRPITSLAYPPIHVSSTFRHDNALMIWDALRECRNLEYLASQNTFNAEDKANIEAYFNDCFANLRDLRPKDEAWIKVLSTWRNHVSPVYAVWWDTFNIDDMDKTNDWVEKQTNK